METDMLESSLILW